ncbi:Ras family protein, putative [Ichthyophthirius multifiliis]|uniref:Ras family protein, putative n=1 Tax=Ichthyophthirius multifiliis TaxID=5932 RepID=G0QLX9_ICHMU|nr:Ras family protein, putative [Ichthyophthirius multifiliis]EGR33774.1 Ras family protein, putative [Ichthyophthirius multifiliis]|eukprot:XP_004038998.1 Ras family protein, putative [Ichthyophthirius multifiliis]
MSYQYLFKYIIIGDTVKLYIKNKIKLKFQGVGKSSLLLKFIKDQFKDQHEITVGVEFGSKNIRINNINVKLQIWDTAGQEDFKCIIRSYYRSSAGSLIVYDITRRETFQNIVNWLNEARENGNSQMVYMLIGNKCDLETQRQVSYEEGKELALSNDMLYIETSAKTQQNVEQVFSQTAYLILEKIQNGNIDPTNLNNGIKIGQEIQGNQGNGDGFKLINNNQNENKSEKQKNCC